MGERHDKEMGRKAQSMEQDDEKVGLQSAKEDEKVWPQTAKDGA